MQSEQLLANIFLLCLENDHLRLQISKRKDGEDKEDEYVLKRIEMIEASMGKQLKYKEEKIGELNQHIREIHGLNENISSQLDTLRFNYKNLQQLYVKEVSEYKQKLSQHKTQYFKSLQAIKTPFQKCCEHEYTVRVLEREKEQLSSQIERLTKVTIKELQTDLEILMKQNQSYMLSINNYRAEQNSFKSDKIKYEQEIKKYCEQANQNAMAKFESQKNAAEIKAQNEKLRVQYQDLEKQSQQSLEKLKKANSEAVAQLDIVINQKEGEISKLKQKARLCGEQLEKKSRKLKEYDDQYAIYLTKMSNLVHQANSLKQQNGRIKQKSEQLICQSRQMCQQKIDKIISSHNAQTNKIRAEYEAKIKDLIVKSSQDKLGEIKELQRETSEIKNEFENLLKDQQIKYRKIEQERDNAIKQWEELLAEMSKQKVIISSLQKQIDCYRKSNHNFLMGHTTPDNVEDAKKSIISQNSQFQTQRRSLSTNRDRLIENSNRDLKSNQHRLKSQYTEHQEAEQQNYLIRIQKLKEENASRAKQLRGETEVNNMYCQTGCENGRKSFDSMKREHPGNSNYSSTQIPRSKSISSTRERYSTVASKQSHLQTPYNILRQNSKQLHSGSSTQNQRPPLSSKRKDGNFKKYEYLRTKTQQNIQSNYQYIPKCKQVAFFQENSQPAREIQRICAGYNIQQNYKSLRAHPSQQMSKNDHPQKLIRSSSLQKVNYDNNLDQIQQYLSFNLNSVKKMSRSASDHKFRESHQPQGEAHKSRGAFYDSIPQKNLLVQKINNIGSAREQQEMVKQSKFYNFCKRPQPQTLSRGSRMEKNTEKENINQIIHRKCQYISEM